MVVNRNSRRYEPNYGGKRQGGSVIVMAALMISLIALLLSIIDIGFLYFYKREYQKSADLGAMAGARNLLGTAGTLDCAGSAMPAATISVSQNMAGRSFDGMVPICGRWTPNAATPDARFVIPPADEADTINAVRVTVTGHPPRFLPFMLDTPITVTATAVANLPEAQLKIRSTLVTLQDGVVNALLGSLLGGNAALNVVGWQGVANADVNLLQFLGNALGVGIDADIGTYQSLLQTPISIGQLLSAEIAAVGSQTAAATLTSFNTQLASLGIGSLTVPLGDLLNLQTATQTAALNTTINAFDLVQALIQVANGEHAASVIAPISVPGVLGVTLRASVIEKPQISATGSPALIGSDPENGPNRIYVRTAQVRVLLSVDLSVIGVINQLTNILSGLIDVTLLDDKLHVALQIGGAEGWVTDYSCGVDGSKSLTATTRTAVANASIGKLTSAQELAVFNPSASFPVASPINVLDLKLLGIIPVAAVRIAAQNLPIASTDVTEQAYTATTSSPNGLPELGTIPEPDEMYKPVSSRDIVASLVNTINALKLEISVLNSNLLGSLLNGVLSLVNGLLSSVLAPILDPILNGLLDTLGLDLANADLGAMMSCNTGATLVD